MSMPPEAFSAAHARTYAEGPARQVPGFADLHRMTRLLLAERAPPDGKILVLGAGGGLEIEALAGEAPGWRFTGVDPAPDMLEAARRRLAGLGPRVSLVEGRIEAAPLGPFDGATALLVFHFIPRPARLETLRQLRLRLKPGAPLVVAHISFGAHEPERSAMIARHVRFASGDAVDPARIEAFAQAIGPRLTILPPEEEEAMLAEAGLAGVTLFYAGLSFRGWVGYA